MSSRKKHPIAAFCFRVLPFANFDLFLTFANSMTSTWRSYGDERDQESKTPSAGAGASMCQHQN